MLMRTALVATLALAAGVNAQDPGMGRGRMGRFGPEMAGPPGPRVVGALAVRPGQVVKNAPYSADAITETTQTLPDGNRIRQTSTAKVYRDAEGRVRNDQTIAGLGATAAGASRPQVVFINDPVAGVNYALNPADKTGSKTAWDRPGGDDRRRDPFAAGGRGRGARGPEPAGGRWGGPGGRQDYKTEALGRQTIEGIASEGTRTIQTIPAGQMGNEQPIQIVSERWYSPELHVVILSKHSDPRFGETVFRLTNISRSAPAASLFQPPAEYKIGDAGRPRR